jgi:hypothetical protein
MASLVPSYLDKLARAEKHLVELKEVVDAFAATEPYTVGVSVEGKKKTTIRRLVFTADPANTTIPIVAADVIYNLRSALDHLMSSLVANKDKSSVMFPIFFQGVWEAIVPGENSQRTKERMRWASCIKTLDEPARTILKRLQPPEDMGDRTHAYPLAVVNNLSNRDRHEKLPVFVAGLEGAYFSWTEPDGEPKLGKGIPQADDYFFKDQALLQIPEDAVNVQGTGTPLVMLRVGQDTEGRDRHLRIPSFLSDVTNALRTEVVDPLIPYVQR